MKMEPLGRTNLTPEPSTGSTEEAYDFLGSLVWESRRGAALKESGEMLFVTRFIGDGFAGDLGTWMMGDGLVDLAGTQEADSRVFVTSLCKVLGVGA